MNIKPCVYNYLAGFLLEQCFLSHQLVLPGEGFRDGPALGVSPVAGHQCEFPVGSVQALVVVGILNDSTTLMVTNISILLLWDLSIQQLYNIQSKILQ